MALDPLAVRLVPIHELNRLTREEFARSLVLLFEDAPPLADALFDDRPYRSYEELLDRAEAVLAALPVRQKLAVINSHPRIGEDRDAVRQASALSYEEQGYAAEEALDPAEVARVYRDLAELNQTYERRFGFPFVVFVAGRSKAKIAEVMRQRLNHRRDAEMATALAEMVRIARDRLARVTPPDTLAGASRQS